MMKYNKLIIFGFLIIFLSCKSHVSRQVYSIKDFVRQTDTTFIDTSKYLTYSSFLKGFDTVPIDFGYIIFNELINPIPIDSSKFKQLWNWEIDTITIVMARKTNIRLDPNKNLSKETYFFIIEFVSVDSLSIASTIYIDLKNEIIGTYMFSHDSIKYVRYNNDITNVNGLRDKLILHRH